MWHHRRMMPASESNFPMFSYEAPSFTTKVPSFPLRHEGLFIWKPKPVIQDWCLWLAPLLRAAPFFFAFPHTRGVPLRPSPLTRRRPSTYYVSGRAGEGHIRGGTKWTEPAWGAGLWNRGGAGRGGGGGVKLAPVGQGGQLIDQRYIFHPA
uniref:Uncharacterized protein n=1 Tax=Morchella brunnea TaxID=1174671 RepID=A0A8K1I7L0_9PEZI|nr:hypothetical protein LK370_mgp091 [Morchella brunnea]UBU98393.1 hypothetical protein [Morchella brunnea]